MYPSIMSLSPLRPNTQPPAKKQQHVAAPEKMQHRGEKRAALHRQRLGVLPSGNNKGS